MSVYEIIPALPDVPVLRERCRALAVLEAVMDPIAPRFGYAAHWSATAEVATMDNGSGDEYAVVFTAAGAFARGFDHESPMSPYADDDFAPWPGLVDRVPEVFREFVTEPAFCDDDGAGGSVPRATVVFWRESADTAWRTGPVEVPADGPYGCADGAGYLFGMVLAGTPAAYREWAGDYYGRSVDPDAVRHVFAGRPLTEAVVAALNPAVDRVAVARAVAATGYPVAPAT